MALVGMLHFRKHPAKVKKAYACAAVAKMENIPFIYFSYNQVNFQANKINGWIYENGSWVQQERDIPKVIINSGSPKTTKQSKILKKLKKIAKLTSHSVGNKMKVYNKVLNGKEFASYLIPSVKLTGIAEIDPLFEVHPMLVIKPYSGNHGKNIYFLEKNQEKYILIDGDQRQRLLKNDLDAWLRNINKDKKFLVQPFIRCETKAGLTYDFRIHVQKNGKGEWEVNLIYPRISGNDKLISNVSSGGYRGELTPFLKYEYGDSDTAVRGKLEEFALTFSKHFDTLYSHNFDELGIDVGIDENLNLWIFEVNWRPGAKNREFEVARRLIPYCKFLIKN